MYLYFAIAVGTNRVKIGKTDNVAKRMMSLKTGCPYPVMPVAKLKIPRYFEDVDWEAKCHEEFNQYRKNGEWFDLSDEIIDFIEMLNSRGIKGFLQYFDVQTPSNWLDIEDMTIRKIG